MSGDPDATVAGLAALTFELMQAAVLRDPSSRAAFLRQATDAHQALVTGMGMLAVTLERLADGLRMLRAAEGEEIVVRALEEAAIVADWLRGAADTMQVVVARMAVAAARVTEGVT